MIRLLHEQARNAGGARVMFVYEASGQGFGLYDELTAAGIQCYVLAPTRIARSRKQKKRKTDEQDALQLLELLRAHVLAGNCLPTIWIPDAATRDDREVVRLRLELADKQTRVKAQVKGLLKRNGLRRPDRSSGWTKAYWRWLDDLARGATLPNGARLTLASLLRQLLFLEQEIERADAAVLALALSERYRKPFYSLLDLKGVGALTSMVFLTEIGELQRFVNRRQIAAYVGLVPRSAESGETRDRKGRITRDGPYRVRKVLCQATWARVRYDAEERRVYERLVQKNPKKKKIAVVASMRRLAVRMWHRAVDSDAPQATSAPARQKGAAPPRLAPCLGPAWGEGRGDGDGGRG
jgi:transposase